MSFMIASQRASYNSQVPSTLQSMAMGAIILSILIEYLFLAFAVIGLLVEMLRKTKGYDK